MNHHETIMEMTNEIYSVMEEMILASMAAGIPVNQIVVDRPHITYGERSVYLTGEVSFIAEVTK